MKTISQYLVWLVCGILLHLTILVFSQPATLDYWYQVNDGFSKCATMGQTAGIATWYRDNFDIVDMIHKEGDMYCFVSYNTSPSVDSNGTPLPEYNYQPCTSGLFKHDKVQNKWFRVADMNLPSAYYTPKMYTNGTDIIALTNYGNIYILDASQANGWRLLTTQSLKEKDFFRITKKTSTGSMDWRNMTLADLIGDTLFVLIATHAGNCNFNVDAVKEQGVIKVNIKNLSLTYDSIGAFPGQQLCLMSPRGWDGDHFDSYKFVDHVGGRFYLFATYRDALNRDSCWNYTSKRGEYATVRVVWTWDPARKKWFNISQGPDWRNLTPSTCTGDNGMYSSWDKKRFFLSIQQGIFEWQGDQWQYRVVGGSYNTGPVIPVYRVGEPQNNITFYIMNRSGVEMIDLTNRTNLGSNKNIFTWCIHNSLNDLNTPDNGTTLYVEHHGMKYPDICGWSGNLGATLGIYWLQPDPFKASSTINLHLESGTYIGGSGPGENMAIGVAVAGKHHILAGGNFNSPVRGNFKTGYTEHYYNGATTTSRAKVIHLNTYGDTIYSITCLGNVMYDMDAQNFGQYRIAVCGDWGVSVLDSSGKNLIYTQSNNNAPLNTFGTSARAMKVDIDDNGHVVVAKNESDFTDPSAVLQRATLFVFDQNGNPIGPSKWVGASEFAPASFSNWHIQDVVIHNDTVYVSGFNQDNLNGNYPGSICNGNGLPVQSAFVLAYKVDASGWTRLWLTFGFDGNYLAKDVADTRGYHINMGKDGKLYYLGEAAGTESVYRFNGKECQCCDGDPDQPASTLRIFDLYNNPYNTGSAHIAYFCTIDRGTGVVERGMYILPRLSTGKSNSFRISDGTVHADQKGYVYVGGRSSASIMGRDMMHINGELLGNYAGGDMCIHIVTPDYTARTFWGAFNKDNNATGNIIAIGIRDNIIAAFGNTEKGSLFTGATHYDTILEEPVFKPEWAMNSTPFTTGTADRDAWLGVWYQDVWNHARKDNPEPRLYTSRPVMNNDCFKNRADLLAENTEVCLGQPVTVINASTGDSCCYTWKFGAGADLLNGTQGKGPWMVTYSTPGKKSLFLSIYDSCNNYQYIEKYDYIQVLPSDLSLSKLNGPSSVCEGASVFFTTDDLTGVEKYEWTVPSGAVITKGNGTYSVQVMFANVSGNVSVRAKYACGYTNTLSTHVTVNNSDPNQVLVITAEDAPLSPSDNILKDKLTALGYAGWFRDDDEVLPSDYQCAGSIIITGPCDETKVKYLFTDAPVPAIVMNHKLFTEMGMTGGNESVDYGQIAGTEIHITNFSHDLTQGFLSGPVAVYATGLSDSMVYAIDCGRTSGSYMGSDGVVYYPDNYYSGGSIVSTASAIASTTDDVLYQTVRKNQDGSYNFPVSSGVYEITLKFANIDGGGDRINLIIEGETKLSSFSVKTLAGTYTAYDLIYTVDVSDGQINIKWGRIANDYPYIAAIKIRKIKSPRIQFGRPASSAVIVANTGIASQSAIFAYEAGMRLIGYANDTVAAPERRVGFFLDRLGPLAWTASGERLFENALCWCNYNCPNLVSVTTDTVIGSLCPGRAVSVRYTATGTFNAGNRFIAQLSNAYGSFADAKVIGQVNATTSGVIPAVIPKPLLPGSAYSIRVVSTSPSETGTALPAFTIGGTAPVPGPIYGSQYACKFKTVQTYSIDPVPGALGYLWEIPLGTHFVSPAEPGKNAIIAGTSVTIDFGTGTTNEIIVRTVNECDTSDFVFGSSRLLVQMTEYPPRTPSSIAGRDTVCQNYTGTYTVPLSADAVKYGWIIPPEIQVVGPDTLNYIQLRFNGTADLTNYTIQCFAVGECGVSRKTTKIIRVDNVATRPRAGAITARPGLCPGEFIYSVVPWTGALSYNWLLPPGAYGVSATNEIYVTYGTAVNGTIGVSITDHCGTGNISTLPVSVSVSGRQAILQVANVASLTDHEITLRDRLRDTLGYTVLLKQYNSAVGSELSCTDVVIISGDVNDANDAFKNATVPVVAMTYVRDMMSSWIYKELEMCDDAGSADNYTPSNKPVLIQIISNTHPVTYGFPLGDVAVMQSSNNAYLTWITPLPSATLLARMKYGSHTGDGAVVVYETGAFMDDGFRAPARRVALPYSHFNGGGWELPAPNFTTELTAMGRKLFDQAVCWAAGNCTNCPPSMISSSEITHVRCAGSSDGAIDISIGAGSAPFTFRWSNGSSSQDVLGLSAGFYRVTVTDKNNCKTSGGYVVSEPATLSVVTYSTHVSCFGFADGSVTVHITGGSTPYTYFWNNGQSLHQLSGLGAGNYLLTISDQKGCTLNAAAMVTQPAALSLSFMVTHVSVHGGADGSAEIMVSGGTTPYFYLWSNGSTGVVNQALTSGYHTVSVTDARGCRITSDVAVSEPGVLLLNASVRHITCAGGSNGKIDISVSGGVTPYLFEWSTGVIAEDIEGLTAGVYTVSVTDNHRTQVSRSFIISQPALLTVQNMFITHCSCYGFSNAAIKLTVGGGISPYSYAWNNGRNTSDIVALTAADYTVTVTDAALCSFNASVNISQPPAITLSATITPVSGILSADGSVDLEVSGGISPYSCLWSNGSTSTDINGLSAGIYRVTVTDQQLCSSVGIYTVSLPEPLQIMIFPSSEISCSGANDGSLIVAATGGFPPYRYLWSDTRTSQIITALSAGSYSVTVTDSHFNSVSDTAVLSEPDDLSVISVSKINVSCYGSADGAIEVIAAGGTSPYSYVWSNGSAGDFTVVGLSAGIHTVTITDRNNCTEVFSVEIRQPMPLSVSEEIKHPYCNERNDGFIILTPSGGTGDYIYQWSNGEKKRILENLSPGRYLYTVTDENFCGFNGDAELKPAHDICVQVPTAFSPNNDGINDLWDLGNLFVYYPNAKVEVFSRWGEIIIKLEGGKTQWDGAYLGHVLPVDSYHYVINLNNGTKPIIGQVTILR